MADGTTIRRLAVALVAMLVAGGTSFVVDAADTNASTVTASPALKQAWDEYLATLDQMRVQMEATPRFQNTPEHRAKAYHTLMEMQAMAYNFAVAPRMSHPRVYA